MKNNFGFVVIFLVFFFLVERLLLDNSFALTKLLEFQLVAIWATAQYRSYKNFGLFSLYSLFLVGMFVFSVGAIFHFLVSSDDIRYVERGFGDHIFSYKTIQEALWAYSVFILLSYTAYNYLYRRTFNNVVNNISILGHNERFVRIGIKIMWIFLVFQIYKGYLYYNAFNDNRVEIFLLGNMANPVPTWVRFIASFYEYGYYFILAGLPDEKTFKKYTLLYFVVLIPELLLGNRGMFGAFALFYLWYYYKVYNKMAIKTQTAVVLGLVMLVLFQLMEFMRDGANFNLASISLTKFLVSQGVSFYILPLYIDYSDNLQYYLYPFVLYNILGGFSGYTGQSIEVLMHKCGVGHQLMYAVDPNYYLAGASFGSSSITEIYDAGIIGFIILSLFFSYMLFFFEKKFTTSRFFCFAGLVLFANFILSSRGSYFPSLYAIVKLFLFYKFIKLFIHENTFTNKIGNNLSHNEQNSQIN